MEPQLTKRCAYTIWAQITCWLVWHTINCYVAAALGWLWTGKWQTKLPPRTKCGLRWPENGWTHMDGIIRIAFHRVRLSSIYLRSTHHNVRGLQALSECIVVSRHVLGIMRGRLDWQNRRSGIPNFGIPAER